MSTRPSRRATLSMITALATLTLMLLGPLSVLAFGELDLDTHWSAASRESAGLAPDAATTPEPVLQVYGARTYNWRGAFGIHTWIAAKRRSAPDYTVYHVIGWQFSVYGLLGIAVGTVEGLEINLLGLNAGTDPDDLALRLPGLGKVGLGD